MLKTVENPLKMVEINKKYEIHQIFCLNSPKFESFQVKHKYF